MQDDGLADGVPELEWLTYRSSTEDLKYGGNIGSDVSVLGNFGEYY